MEPARNLPALGNGSPEPEEQRMAHILVLDDEQDACSLMARVLSALGHEVQVFTDYLPVLDWLELHTPDLALIDIKLRRGSGLKVLEFIRIHLPQTKVMMITGSPSAETSRKADQLGIDDYLVKPIDIDELERRLNDTLLGKKREKY
jgi:DNA-binding response OmpR family regulator